MQDLALPPPEERQNLKSLKQPENIAAKSDPRLQGVSNKSCNLLLQSDTPLWNRVIKLAHINGNVDAAVTEISTILHQHVQAAQTVFNSHVFRDHSGKLEFSGIGFLVYQVVINVTDVDCKRRSEASAGDQDSDAQSNRQNDGSYADQNPFCSESIDVTNTLNLFSYNKFDGYCAAYLFTYRDFVGGTLGLAWVGSACSRYRLVSEGTQDVRKSLNTGLVTLVNYGNPVPSQVSQVTFIHELGHNFGAQHDNNHQDQPYGCLPSTHDSRGNYIMFASATSGTKENNRRFSKCSLDSIARFLHGLSTNGRNCFVQSGEPFCGNSLVEADEECDCGVSSKTCRDKCCNPRNSASPCKLVDHIMVNGIAHKEGTRVCKQGQCVGSICESIPNWIECTVARDESVTSESLCYVACQENKTGAVCVSSEMLLKDSSLQTQYPKLTKVLLKNSSPMRMSAGTPCDSYQGYCDRFHRCISVDVKGPLARLKNLLFSPRMLDKAKSWVTFHWWAMILMCLGAVISMIVFVKLCARHTPMARSRYPHRGRAVSTAPAVWVAEHWPDGAEEPEGPPPPYSPHPEEYYRRHRDQADIVTPSHSRWAWPKNKAPESRQPKRSKGLHSAKGAPPAARRARCRTAEDMAPYPNARRRPLPPSHPKSTMRNSGVPEETAMKLTPIMLHESADNNGSRPSNNNALPGPSENPSPQAASQAKFSQVPRTGATKSRRHMTRTSGVRRPVSVPRPTSMFVRSPNPASIARPDPPRQPRGPRRGRPTIRPVSTIFHSDDVNIGPHVHQSPPALLEEWSLIPTSACIPVRSSARAAQPIRQFSAEPGTSELMHAGPSASTEMSSVDSGLPPPAYTDL
ncbi:Disintegrin and metalloproteinase [Fasciola gigantica]|uniref:ADAM10 endopeptidase n=1 Tax=Fasciola gigantica TaxID=46835 RepID=A0A504YPD2_FASGI|nr:Disintegrin and metalloproteinase [Fasciola gigantica]